MTSASPNYLASHLLSDPFENNPPVLSIVAIKYYYKNTHLVDLVILVYHLFIYGIIKCGCTEQLGRIVAQF